MITRITCSTTLVALCAFASAAPSDQMVGYWTLDSHVQDSATAGATADHGAWSGTASYITSGVFGQAITLDGTNHVEIPHSSDLDFSNTPLTLSVWCKVSDWSYIWETLLAKGNDNNIRLVRYGNDPDQIAYWDGAGIISGGAVNDGAWHHIAVVSDPGDGRYLFVDGQEVSSSASSSIVDSGLPLRLGGNPAGATTPWKGNIDELALMRTALNSFQARSIHQFATQHQYAIPEVIQLLDLHASTNASNFVTLGSDNWFYQPSDNGNPSFVLLDGNGSGVSIDNRTRILSFTSSDGSVIPPETATLSWQVDPNYTSLTIDQGIGDVSFLTDASGNGSIAVAPTVSTRYTLSATNAAGTTTRELVVFAGINPDQLQISEFMASNNSTLTDQFGESPDWIEIRNPSATGVDLSGYYLTDDPLLPRKWPFPSTTLDAGAYLVIMASGRDLRDPYATMHTNFNLSSAGEYLALNKDDGIGGYDVLSAFSPTYPPQETDISYGIDLLDYTPGYQQSPTPGSANGPTSAGFVADTSFDVDRGFYTTGFNLTISTLTPGATIRYTTDGSTPSETHGTIYNGPIFINKTRVIRAMAYKSGYFPTDVDTQTYFFANDIRTQYANGAAPTGWPTGTVNSQVFNYGMDPEITIRYTGQQMMDALMAIPSISIATDQANLTNASTGIYVNAGSRGKSWERPASFEIIDPTGNNISKQTHCGLRIRGGFSRTGNNPKHAFRLFFRSEYGDSKLNYPLFQGEGVDQFDKVDLRTSQNYSWSFGGDTRNTFLREILGRDLQRLSGETCTRSRYYHLYLNGVYWGLYMTHERAEANHGAAYLGGDKDNYDTIKSAGGSGGYNTEATDGTMDTGSAWQSLWNLTRAQNSSPTTTRFMQMQGFNANGSRNPNLPQLLDVNNLIEYMLIFGYIGHIDGPISTFLGGASNNWFGVRDRVRDKHGFQFFIHDGEHSLGLAHWGTSNDRLNSGEGSQQRGSYSKSNPYFMHRDLASSTYEYQLRFADRAHRAFFNDGYLTTENVLATLEPRRSVVDSTIIAESARWGDSKRTDPLDKEDWQGAVNFMISTINSRRSEFFNHMRTAGLYPDLDAPSYLQHGGRVAAGSTVNVIVPNAASHLYYCIGSGDSNPDDWQDDLDPRLLGGAINPAAGVMLTGTGGGGANTTVIPYGSTWKFLDNGSNQGTAWRDPAFNDGSWASGPGQLGFGDGDEATIINGGPAGGRYATTYFRKQINISDPTQFGDMELQVTYDDSYVIYVNGTLVHKHSGLPDEPAYSQYSTNTVSDNAIDTLSISPGYFQSGTNTIAVELHQTNTTSSDLSFDLRLIGRPPGSGATITLQLSDTIDSPSWVKSRTYNANTGEWSAINEAFFTTAAPASAANIVISEVHYHPADPTPGELAVDPTFSASDFEFVEIMNISANTVDLGESAFVLTSVGANLDGIEFTFPVGTEILPGQRLVIVADTLAFQTRYPGIPIAGDYSSRLSNGGEWVTLVNKDGAVIDTFRYDDVTPWPTEADGLGYSLTLANPQSNPDPTDPLNWAASNWLHGSPGEEGNGIRFTGDPLADDDGDGVVAIVEYLMGLSDTIPSPEHFPFTGTIESGGERFLTFTYRHDPDAIDALPMIERSFDMETWEPTEGTGFMTWVGDGVAADGIPTHTYRCTSPVSATPRAFLRLAADY